MIAPRFDSHDSLNHVKRVLVQQGSWATSRELAVILGWPWRVVARTLKLLVARGDIEERVSEVKAKRSRIRKRTHYRLRYYTTDSMPRWLQPKIVAARPPTRIIRF